METEKEISISTVHKWRKHLMNSVIAISKQEDVIVMNITLKFDSVVAQKIAQAIQCVVAEVDIPHEVKIGTNPMTVIGQEE